MAISSREWSALEPRFSKPSRALVPASTIGAVIRSCDRSDVFQRHGNMALNIAGDCLSPVTRMLYGHPTETRGWLLVVTQVGRWLPTMELEVRCRRCAKCLKWRSRQWVARAVQEIECASRTWFCTFTLSPHSTFMLKLRASQRLRAGGTDLSEMSGSIQLEELRREFGAELQKYFKRLRKSGAVLRYYLVFERHKSGMPHAHALIHEVFDAHPVRHSTLTANWTLGHTKFKLADLSSARYVAKYLTKEAGLRVRCSFAYGRRLSPQGLASAAKRDISPAKGQTGTQATNVVWPSSGSYGTLGYRSCTASADIGEQENGLQRRKVENETFPTVQGASFADFERLCGALQGNASSASEYIGGWRWSSATGEYARALARSRKVGSDLGSGP